MGKRKKGCWIDDGAHLEKGKASKGLTTVWYGTVLGCDFLAFVSCASVSNTN